MCNLIAQEAEEEKEDLKDAVLKLVEKGGLRAPGLGESWNVRKRTFYLSASRFSPLCILVETSNDYSKWSHSRMHTTGPLALVPIDSNSNSALRSDTVVSQDGHPYASALIQELTRRLAQEQKVHARMQMDAETRISCLEVQLALREAELEAWIVRDPTASTGEPGSGSSRPISGPGVRSAPENPAQPVMLSQDDAVEILQSAAVRNRKLEAEIRTIADKVNICDLCYIFLSQSEHVKSS